MTRDRTRLLKAGSLAIGGGSRVSVQTMCNVDPHDAAALSAQIESCARLGCDLIRLTVPDVESATTLKEVRKSSPIPIVSDIHYDWHCALAAIDAGTDALRLNPGNIGARDRVQAVARAAKEKRIPIRIGVNFGSREKDLEAKARSGRIKPSEALVESALRHLAILEGEGFRDVAISAKASNALETIATYRLLAERTDCPLHVGVTEAGTFLPGTVRNSVALGVLLSEGIGDTIRVSLTAEPEKEVRVGMEILRSLGLRAPGPAITSCPTCGRTKIDLMRRAGEVEEAMEAYAMANPGAAVPHVAVMGCAVNGLGEAKGADIALCGGAGDCSIFVKGELAAKVDGGLAARKVMEYVVSLR